MVWQVYRRRNKAGVCVYATVGRISLGRILNVVGSAVDMFDDQPIGVVYGESPVCKRCRIGHGDGTLVGTILKQESGYIIHTFRRGSHINSRRRLISSTLCINSIKLISRIYIDRRLWTVYGG